ncbi:MAG: response regulator [Bacteroidota bacterium]|nr:response regulator [Bacteroidota bacterium]MDP4230132.1 response regulator [Bacteroidota bacterium]MDP4237283.1 response regulator [Bacteroidota bacterium]
MDTDALHILLADDDEDDRLFFKDAIESIRVKTVLKMVNDGQQLMDLLIKGNGVLPDIIFLDLNMPRKGGIECLEEIRSEEKYRNISIVIYSTSSSEEDIEKTFLKGANIYLRKPDEFGKLKKMIAEVLSINWQYHTTRLNKENFLLVI